MVLSYLSIRSQICKLIDKYGVSITRTPETITYTGDYNEKIETAGSTNTITAYVQAGVKSNKNITKTGQVSDVDLKLIVKYDVTIGTYDKFSYQGDTYQVKVKEDLNEVYIQNYLVYKVINLYRLS